MLEVAVERGRLESLLPHLRDIVMRTLSTGGLELKADAKLEYVPRIDENPEKITVELYSPLVATIVGKWFLPGYRPAGTSVSCRHIRFVIESCAFDISNNVRTESIILPLPITPSHIVQGAGQELRGFTVDE